MPTATITVETRAFSSVSKQNFYLALLYAGAVLPSWDFVEPKIADKLGLQRDGLLMRLVKYGCCAWSFVWIGQVSATQFISTKTLTR